MDIGHSISTICKSKNVAVTMASTDGMEVIIRQIREGQVAQVTSMGHGDRQLDILWKPGPIRGEPVHSKMLGHQGLDERGDTSEVHRVDKEKD